MPPSWTPRAASDVVLARPDARLPLLAQTTTDPGFRLPGLRQGEAPATAAEVLELVASSCHDVISPERLARFRAVARRRCFDVVPVLENPADAGNVAAVMRTADALGIGRAHLILPPGTKSMKQGPRAAAGQGTDKWVLVTSGTDASAELATLRAAGYRIAATHVPDPGSPVQAPGATRGLPSPGLMDSSLANSSRPPPLRASVCVTEVDWTVPTAVIVGNEKDGVSPAMLNAADLLVRLPMDGLVESLNVSVCASLILWHARLDRLRRRGPNGHADLTDEQVEVLTAAFCLRHRRNTAATCADLLKRAEGTAIARRLESSPP